MPKKLVSGVGVFHDEAGMYGPDGLMPKLVEEGQHPEYVIISCIDSRVALAKILNLQPGDVFPHTAMGNIVKPHDHINPDDEFLATLEYALDFVDVPKIVVLGHSHCGAMGALINGIDSANISKWVENARPAFNDATCAHEGITTENPLLFRETELRNVLLSSERLRQYPVVAKALEAGKLEILPMYFEIKTGNLYQFSNTSGEFESLTQFGQSHDLDGVTCQSL